MGGKTMERKYAALAENILSHIGGKDNIIHMTHCVTRLRLELKDDKKADLDALNAMNGIAGTFWRGGQLQIMIGSQVKEVFAELVSCAGVPGEEPGTRQKPGQPGEKEIHIAAPVSGRVIALSQIEDEAFASGVLGQGAAILPSDGKIYAPADGTITTFFSTGHAVSLTAEAGPEILIHVGVDTVQLSGMGFSPKKKQGDRIKTGDLLLEVDLEALRSAGYATTTAVIVTNTDQYGNIVPTALPTVEAGETLIKIL